jgi:hypothetical protein
MMQTLAGARALAAWAHTPLSGARFAFWTSPKASSWRLVPPESGRPPGGRHGLCLSPALIARPPWRYSARHGSTAGLPSEGLKPERRNLPYIGKLPMLHASSRALDPGPAGPDNAADGLRIPFSPMRRPKTTLVLVRSGTGHDGGCCRSRTTGNAAALRWHPPTGQQGSSPRAPRSQSLIPGSTFDYMGTSRASKSTSVTSSSRFSSRRSSTSSSS